MAKRKNRAEPRNNETHVASEFSASCASATETALEDDPESVARYLADMTNQLERIARASNHTLLAYLLAMASAQASGGQWSPERSYSLH
jgi:hypothetical protein